MKKIKTAVIMILCIFLFLSAVYAETPGGGIDSAVSVGNGGDFSTVAEAIRASEGKAGRLEIKLTDSPHTEAGIVINCDVIIRGFGVTETIIQAAEERSQRAGRVFLVTAGGKLELHDLTVRHGDPSEIPFRGGGIDSEGELFMYNCSVSGNDAIYGAGIFTRGRTRLENCLIADNATYKAPTSLLRTGIGCVGSGGGIKTEKGAELRLENCSLIGNSSVRRGGGLFVACESSAELINTTVAENSCGKRGGGICSKGDLILRFSTIAYNESVQRGSGLCNMGRLIVLSSLLTGNSCGDFAEIDAYGIYGKGFTEESSANFCADGSMPEAAAGNARANPLKQYSATAFLVPIGLYSPARNTSAAAGAPVADGRGVLRDMRPDAGAYEMRPVPWKLSGGVRP